MHKAGDGRLVVPLLHPTSHKLPFGMALELHPSAAPAAPHSTPRHSSKGIYELRFVLDGRGVLRPNDGQQESLQPGDTVLMTWGAAACEAAGAGRAAVGEERSPWGLASLVIYLPASLVEAARGPQGRAGEGSVSEAEVAQVAAAMGALHGGSGGPTSLPPHAIHSVLAGAKGLATSIPSSGAPTARTAAPAVQWWEWGWIAPAIAAASKRLKHVSQPCAVPIKRALQDLTPFRLPNQTNRVALAFDPLEAAPVQPGAAALNFCFGVEVFEPLHRTTPHRHPTAHELFFVLCGFGEGFCDGHRFPLTPGDVALFQPGSLHGLDNGGTSRMYCLELMLPNEDFAEMVRAGQPTGALAGDDLCVLARIGCS